MSKSPKSALRIRDISSIWIRCKPLIGALALLTTIVIFATAPSAHAAMLRLQLVMIEKEGCSYCDLWHKEIGKTYAATAEGRRAPLVRLDIASATAQRFSRVIYTPTFILVRTDGQEIGRIVGYPGADHFWGELKRLLSRAGETRELEPTAPAATPARYGLALPATD